MNTREVQPGFRSGLLEVVSEAPRLNGGKAWLCRCDCGGEKIVTENHLKTEHTKSCGCLSRKKPLAVNMRIGQLTILAIAPKKKGRRYWHCRCDCGNECTVQESHIRSGHTKSCGCAARELGRARAIDLTGRRFGRLTAIRPTDRRRKSSVIWHCRCDCGGETYVESDILLRGNSNSCGCIQAEQRKINMKKAIHFIDGTCIEKIAVQRENAANTSGHRGVYPLKNGKFRASITFQGKRHDLGTHRSFQEAVEARLQGEEEYYGAYLEDYYAKQKTANTNHNVLSISGNSPDEAIKSGGQ